MAQAESADQLTQVAPGAMPHAPVNIQVPAEATGGSPEARAVAGQGMELSQHLADYVQLEVIKQDKAAASNGLKNVASKTINTLSGPDGLETKAWPDFVKALPGAHKQIIDAATQALNEAPNDQARDMLRQSLNQYMDEQQQRINESAMQKQHVYAVASYADAQSMYVADAASAKTLPQLFHSLDFMTEQNKSNGYPIYGLGEGQEGLSPQIDQHIKDTGLASVKAFLNAAKQRADLRTLNQALADPRVQGILNQKGDLAAFSASVGKMNFRQESWETTGGLLEQNGPFMDGQQKAIDWVRQNKRYEGNIPQQNQLVSDIKQRFGAQRASILQYMRANGGNLPMWFSEKYAGEAHDWWQKSNAPSNQRELLFWNSARTSNQPEEREAFSNTNFADPSVAPDLNWKDRQSMLKSAQGMLNGANPVDNNDDERWKNSKMVAYDILARNYPGPGFDPTANDTNGKKLDDFSVGFISEFQQMTQEAGVNPNDYKTMNEMAEKFFAYKTAAGYKAPPETPNSKAGWFNSQPKTLPLTDEAQFLRGAYGSQRSVQQIIQTLGQNYAAE